MATFMTFTSLISSLCHLLRLFFPQRSGPTNPGRIIILKPCCLGDVVLATATVAALKHYFPQARLDFAVGPWSQAVLVDNPHLDSLIDSGSVGQGGYGWSELWTLVRQLRASGYDLAVTLDRSPLVGLIPWLAGIKHRVGLDSYGRGFAHTVRVAVPEAPKHEALIYLACAEAATLAASTQGEYQFQTEFYPPPQNGLTLPPVAERPFVILHPSGGVNPGMTMLDKRWPSARFAGLADRLSRQGFQIVLTGVEADMPLCREIAGLMQTAAPQIVAGQLSLAQFGLLCRRAALFIGGDTGAMHLAVACGCKTVAIFGPSDPKRYAPFAPATQARFVWRSLALPTGGVGQGQVENFNWADGASVDQVLAACQALLEI